MPNNFPDIPTITNIVSYLKDIFEYIRFLDNALFSLMIKKRLEEESTLEKKLLILTLCRMKDYIRPMIALVGVSKILG